VTRFAAALARLRGSRPWRAWDRYGQVRGSVLAGGIAFFAFFALFPVLAIGFTLFGLLLAGRADLQGRVVDYVNGSFGGAHVIATAPGGIGLVTVHQLVASKVLTLSGAIGLVVLLLAGLGWVGALREGISAVFGQVVPNRVVAGLGDLGLLVMVGLAALASGSAGVVVTTATGQVLDGFGVGRSRLAGVAVAVLTALVLLAIDSALFLLLFRLGGVRLPFDDVFTAALGGAVAFGLLKVSGGVLLRAASHNHLLAAFSIVVGLLVWMNLASRVALLTAAWAATTAHDRGHLPDLGSPSERVGTVGVGTVGVGTVGVGTVGVPSYGTRAADRTTLLAGAVLGATALVVVRALGTAGRTVREVLRREG
jgi:membrane protein